MSLKNELEAGRKEIKTDSYPISIRELSSLYREGELDIHPEFQRFQRWTIEQKTKFIESILLGIPIPSIFLFQRADGVLDVVDGLQRISTILNFMGDLKDENGNILPYLTLGEAQYLPSLKGKRWKSSVVDEEIGDDIQKFFRSEKIDAKILLRDSDEQAKFELFQRINTGGTPLSDQEVRNCILIMLNRTVYFWMEDLAQDVNFKICCPLPERLLLERYELELILRFILLHNAAVPTVSEIPDLGQFLTTEMRKQFLPGIKDFNAIGDVFKRTFSALNQAAGDNSLRKFDATKSRFVGPFLISAFELVALGVAANIDYVEQQGTAWLIHKIQCAWGDSRVEGTYGQGVSTARRLPKTLQFGRTIFSEP